MNQKTLVFVYGTLKKKESNHRWLTEINAKFIKEHITPATYTMYSVHGMYPAVVHLGEDCIQGEIYEVNNKDVLEHLDYLEGYPELYTREKIPVGNGDEAWIYLYNQDITSLNKIEGGLW